MSTADEIGLSGAKRRLESVATSVRHNLERARRLYGVADRKRAAGNIAGRQDRLAAVRRVLTEAAGDLDRATRHRDRLAEHVQAHPAIEGGIYHGTVETHDSLARTVTERRQRAAMALAVAGHRADRAAHKRAPGGAWEEAFDTVQAGLHLVRTIRTRDLPVLVREVQDRDADEGAQLPTGPLSARLSLAREHRERITALDHGATARAAARVNEELGADYRSMVDRFLTTDRRLEEALALVAASLAGEGGPEAVLESLGIDDRWRGSDR